MIAGAVHEATADWLRAMCGASSEPEPTRKQRHAPRVETQPTTARFFTLAEASALIRTPAETIRYWIWQGRLSAFKPGRAVLLREADLLALVEEHETSKLRAARARRGSR
jgi:excisionase family DNA binding protein